jgi:hypothetical protein
MDGGDPMTKRLSQALAGVKLYTELDLRLVPGEPSPSQCSAGAKVGRISPECARLIYQAMLDADGLSDAGP